MVSLIHYLQLKIDSIRNPTSGLSQSTQHTVDSSGLHELRLKGALKKTSLKKCL